PPPALDTLFFQTKKHESKHDTSHCHMYTDQAGIMAAHKKSTRSMITIFKAKMYTDTKHAPPVRIPTLTRRRPANKIRSKKTRRINKSGKILVHKISHDVAAPAKVVNRAPRISIVLQQPPRPFRCLLAAGLTSMRSNHIEQQSRAIFRHAFNKAAVFFQVNIHSTASGELR
ncbi:unnamed protein product, partial [Ectocarpus sp. 4 AP-2014]